MGREARSRKSRVCRDCSRKFFVNAEGMQIHALICGFEKRTGLTVVAGENLGISLEGEPSWLESPSSMR